MKKYLIFLFFLSIILTTISWDEETVIVPKDAIRYRIIANSNDFIDQQNKLLINTEIEPILGDILDSSDSIEESRSNIVKSIPRLEKVINKYGVDYDINYGINYFPEKTYNEVKYESGNYESLVITLGNGLGDNWWCVLFPPLCLIEAQESDIDDAEYTFFIKNIIDKFAYN